MNYLKNKIVIVTGSSGSIGMEIAKHFSSLGCKVVITGRNEQTIKNVAVECKSNSPHNYEPLQVVCDLANEENIKNLISKTIDVFGKLNILVNNAAIDKQNCFGDINLLTDFDEQLTVNVRAVLQLCQLAMPYLIESKGSIVNISAIQKPSCSCKYEFLENYDELKSFFEQKNVLKRMLEPFEIASCVAFLASDRSSFTTGISLNLDGGELLM
ncbi:L-xylulose reductase-like protein [Leptotrombidium deliense]|uniref:L-xylulose reductase-like protein n=1 Tax=Leptotrombidium deliense TaxID=299467 RepID=A0A443SCI6_9ACAR|nr:L-xylulose reductase-like protein [Leptotrombidium deliense]